MKTKLGSIVLATALAVLAACGGSEVVPSGAAPATPIEPAPAAGAPAGLRLTSPAFAEGDPIPARFTGDGADVSPVLEIADVPGGSRCLALIMDDPDAPGGTWVHWVVWSIPADTRSLAEGSLPDGAITGRNSWGRTGYGGPAPPSGTHRYFFKLYALDTVLELPAAADKAALERAMKGHILAEASLMGTYSR